VSSYDAPVLTGDAARAVRHRGSHLQIIASAGSGKTEVVAQRVAQLIADGESPDSIVAFTFTEKAAAELKARIGRRVEQRLGSGMLDRLGACFVGTIHAYCFRLLQALVPQYETYDVLDDNRLAAFLSRECNRLGVKRLAGKQFESMRQFVANVEVVDNELIPLTALEDPFREILEGFRSSLDQYRLLTYGQQVARAVEELGRAEVLARVHESLRHLIVDEYQDVNPAQEELIRRLTGPRVELCVVGDDDQSIYQWRGSDVSNIVGFSRRYRQVASFRIETNRRSRPEIIDSANGFVQSISGRLPKTMRPHRLSDPRGTAVLTWSGADEAAEADTIARTIKRLNARGVPFRDIAVLVRGRVAYPALLTAFAQHDVPVQPGGRTGLFEQPEAELFAKTYAWLVDHDHRASRWGTGQRVSSDDLVREYVDLYGLDGRREERLRLHLQRWKASVPSEERPIDLVRDFYRLLGLLAVDEWNMNDPLAVARLGALARCTMILADYESVRRRSRPDVTAPGEQVGGQDRGEWYHKNLAIHIGNWANGSYEAFEGEQDVAIDAVDLLTIHRAKGLEWPVVFVPSLTKRRFPSSRTGSAGNWHVPPGCFDAARYEGSDVDERRLFYVAMTRARDLLSLSTYERTSRQRATPSPYLLEVAGGSVSACTHLDLPEAVEGTGQPAGDEPLALTFSELAAYRDCGVSYRLRNIIGFQPALAPELGYGKAVHHVLRQVAEHTRRSGRPPTARQLDRLFDDAFFLPAANKVAHREMKEAARRLVDQYVDTHVEDLHRIWETERPFELHLPSATITGRADVILDKEDGVVSALAIVDYKTSTGDDRSVHDLQLQVYADAGRREGLDVRAAYLHDLKASQRSAVDVSQQGVQAGEAEVTHLVTRLRARDFPAKPGPSCRSCDVRTICRAAAV
jgi:DNA helicase-2/ATP-dependent DNA helicase PcrA